MNRWMKCLLVAAVMAVAVTSAWAPFAEAHRYRAVYYYAPAPWYGVTYYAVPPRRVHYVAPVVPAPVVYGPVVPAVGCYPTVYGPAPVVYYGW